MPTSRLAARGGRARRRGARAVLRLDAGARASARTRRVDFDLADFDLGATSSSLARSLRWPTSTAGRLLRLAGARIPPRRLARGQPTGTTSTWTRPAATGPAGGRRSRVRARALRHPPDRRTPPCRCLRESRRQDLSAKRKSPRQPTNQRAPHAGERLHPRAATRATRRAVGRPEPKLCIASRSGYGLPPGSASGQRLRYPVCRHNGVSRSELADELPANSL